MPWTDGRDPVVTLPAALAIVGEALDEGLVAFDASWRCTYANAAAAALLGRAPATLVGCTPREAFADGAGPMEGPAWTALQRVMTTREAEVFEGRVPGQGRRWLAHRAHPAPDGGVLLFVRDATRAVGDGTGTSVEVGDARAAREALQRREAEFRAMADNIPQLAWMADPDGAIRWYNRRMEEYTGRDADALRGMDWTQVHHPDHVERVSARFLAALHAGEPWEDTFPLRRADGEYRWFLSRATPIRDAAGRIVRWFGTNTDVTEQRAAAAERERLLARAESLQTLTAALARAVTTADVVQAAVQEAGQGVGSHGGAFALLDRDGTTFTLVAGPGITPDIESSWVRWPNAGRLPGPEAVRTGRPVYSRTRAEYVARDPALAPVADQLGIEAEATLPLVVGGRTLGVLSLLFATPRDFGPEDDAFLCTVADQCAQALERARLFEAEGTARRTADADRTRLAGLYALSAALSGARTVGEVADAISDAGAAALGAQQAGIALLDADGATFRFRVLREVPADIADAWHAFPNTPATPYGVVVASRTVLVLPSQAAIVEQFPAVSAEITRQGLETLVVLPLERGARAADAPSDGPGAVRTPTGTADAAVRVLGAVHYGFTTPQRFDAADEAAFAAVARQCAEALERARLFEAEREARARAEAANLAKSEFLATMSHELRTPLNAIQGHVQLLELGLHGPVSDAQRDALHRVARAQTHLLGLINDVLNYAKLEAGKVEFDMREVRVADVVRHIVPLIEPQRQARGLALDVSLPDTAAPGGHDALVWADREKLGQVLLNLLTNAVKFTPPVQADGSVGRIVVELAAPPDGPTVAELRVRDTGIGIPPEKHAAIFEPFVQVNSGLTRTTEGTGLGLAISRDLARGMGGDLVVASAPGAGATFTLTLRRVVGAAGEPTDRRMEPAGVGHRRRDGEERRGTPHRSGADRESRGA